MLRILLVLVAAALPLAAYAADGDDVQAALSRAQAYSLKNELDNAIRQFTEALRLDPKNTAAYNGRGNMHLRKKLYAQAASDYTDALRVNPQNSVAYNNSAHLKATCPDERYRDGKKAVEEATKANELLEWKQWWCIETLASAYAEAGDFPSAIKWQEKVIELASDMLDEAALKERQRQLKLYREKKPLRDE